jgi:hypothetical protein
MTKAYLVTAGSYADYRVERVYLDKQAAHAYVRNTNERDLRQAHDKRVAAADIPPNAHLACRDPIETCPSCGPYFANLENWRTRVEEFEIEPDPG